MAINNGPTVDMATIEQDADLPYYFVEPAGAQQFEHIMDYPQGNSGRLGYVVAPNNPDVNEISLTDIWDKGKEYAKNVGEYLGLVEKEKQPAPPKSTQPKPPEKPKPQPKPQKSPEPPQGEKHIKDLQRYLKSAKVRNFTGKPYTGEIDGIPGKLTQGSAHAIEAKLADMLGTNEVFGTVLKTTPQDIDTAIQLVQKAQKRKVAHSRDERILELCKFL